MKKIVIIILVATLVPIMLIIFAGMYKFNYLAYQPGYDPDGNKISETADRSDTPVCDNEGNRYDNEYAALELGYNAEEVSVANCEKKEVVTGKDK